MKNGNVLMGLGAVVFVAFLVLATALVLL
jgi:hypothetical protein